MNLGAKHQRSDRVAPDKLQEQRLKYLTDEKHIKAVTVMFSDLEGRLHMLDYDKKFLLKSYDNLTFDGSSIRGFSQQRESDLRLALDWSAFYWAPADIFGAGKVLVFGDVLGRDGSPYGADIRGTLKKLSREAFEKDGYTLNAANEIEGFVFQGLDAERRFHQTGTFEYVNTGAITIRFRATRYARSSIRSPKCSARWASRTRKITPKSRPRSSKSIIATAKSSPPATTIQLYKLDLPPSRHASLGMTASFSAQASPRRQWQRHAHQRLGEQEAERTCSGIAKVARSSSAASFAWQVRRSHPHRTATDICLMLNSSVNAYRRLDPHFEAPNQLKASAIDRGSMVRIPIGKRAQHRAPRSARSHPMPTPIW